MGRCLVTASGDGGTIRDHPYAIYGPV